MSRSRGGGRDRSVELRRTYTEFSLSLGSPRARLRRRLPFPPRRGLCPPFLTLVHPYPARRYTASLSLSLTLPAPRYRPTHPTFRPDIIRQDTRRMAATLSA